ncbi:alpha/beta fold hydrolase [Sporosarcina ureilytica]|uniref:AB hydrolase-1 domain-containing protein n=1 Tax=Sporosarcina ureilytica TaxID=298596 RepID=A0A1D8JJ74_9BACL|nr:alpha/beta hydrolase [Sporosarcina ureilytica]AOV08752.1 hypothetical protein BI350_15175 [Sporosarcina ureilytica]
MRCHSLVQQGWLDGLFYEVRGQGETILLLHGIGGSHTMFKPQVTSLSKHYKTVTVDLNGNGNSESVKTKSYLTTHIKCILALMDHLKIKRAILVGLSYGGIITQLFAIIHPDKVKKMKMILIDTYSRIQPKNLYEL